MPRGENLLDLGDRVLGSWLAALQLHSLLSELDVLFYVSVFAQEVKVIDRQVLTDSDRYQGFLPSGTLG